MTRACFFEIMCPPAEAQKADTAKANGLEVENLGCHVTRGEHLSAFAVFGKTKFRAVEIPDGTVMRRNRVSPSVGLPKTARSWWVDCLVVKSEWMNLTAENVSSFSVLETGMDQGLRDESVKLLF